VLESRHLVGLFLMLVVTFAIVFTLGYLLGRSQYDTILRAAAGSNRDAASPPVPAQASKAEKKQESSAALPAPQNSDWDFYHSADSRSAEDHLQPPPKPVAAAKRPAPRKHVAPASRAKLARLGKSSTPVSGSLIPKGAIMLQVAALQREGDALALAQALQQKKFPAFVILPGADKFYRVQVGPYLNAKAAAAGRRSLEASGFKSIIKR